MSKMDALRAMREARYEKMMARSAAATPAARPRSVEPAQAAPPLGLGAAETGLRCGHRSMNGRICTREQGHTAKNHRYS